MTAELESDDSSHIIVVVKRKITSFSHVEVEPVGKWFHYYESLRSHSHVNDLGEDSLDESSEEEATEEAPDVEIEDDIVYLRSLDPADWKNQDHYAVLGLKKYRHKASDEDIKKAYRMMVLRHHPDKRKGAGEEIRDDDDYFTCITKAYETLGIPSKRQAYDSIDPEFDNSVPSANANNKANFFQAFAPAFERNGRWSLRKHVPLLGKPDDSRQKIERFYGFWYDFESWREFSYLDEEEKEKGQDREERRWIEKQNKVERARRKKEEMARIRKLVDNAYASDPRVVKFREEDKEKRLALKKARQDAIRQRQEEEERVRKAAEAEEKRIKEKEAAEIKAKQDAERRERETIKKAYKKEKKTLRNYCKDKNYFAKDESEKVQLMTDVELLCEALELTSLQTLNDRFVKESSNSEEGRELLLKEIKLVKDKIEKEKEDVRAAAARSQSSGGSEGGTSKHWGHEDLQLLIKAVNLFPAGTSKRWEVVAQYLNQHSSSGQHRVAKEVLNKAKELQNSDLQMKEAANKNAFTALEKSHQTPSSIHDSKASQRLETPQEMLGVNLSPWSAEEQRLLEQALKTYPASSSDRWDKIAECVPNRSKKDCMRRYKELVEMVKSKKAAQAAAAAKK